MKLLISGGGTGGHLYPALAIADEWMRRDSTNQVLFVGTAHGLEARVVPPLGYRLELIEVHGFKRALALANVRAAWQFGLALRRAGSLIDAFAPDVVVGTGGYVCAPVLYMAARRGRPCVLQEQNSYPGAVVRWLAPRADQVHLNFAETVKHLKKVSPDRIHMTGNPVRIQPLPPADRARAYGLLGLDARKETVFVMGGSQGARSINAAMAAALDELQDGNLQVLWQTGANNFEAVRRALKPGKTQVTLRPYIEEMAAAYAAADVVVARAGAMSLAELALCGKPAILVPLPIATADHQRKNAETFVQHGAALMILDRDLNCRTLAAALRMLLGDPDRRARMAQASRALAKPEAARHIVDALMKLANKPSQP